MNFTRLGVYLAKPFSSFARLNQHGKVVPGKTTATKLLV